MNAVRACLRRLPGAFRRFLRETRAGTGITAAAVTVMTVGGGALIVDHVWLYDQRDVLKTAADAASIAATLELDRQLVNPGIRIRNRQLKKTLTGVAKRYVLVNLAHLPPERLERAKKTLRVKLDIDRANRTVAVTAKADLGGTLFSRQLPLLGNYKGPKGIVATAGAEKELIPIEVALALDVSASMNYDLAGSCWTLKPDRHCTQESVDRMSVVKDAARHLVDILAPSGQNQVAVGVVPWNHHVRLDRATARKWKRKRAARYPTRRRYESPYENCKNVTSCPLPPDAVEHELPGEAPEPWRGCLGEERLEAGRSTLPSLPDPGGLLARPARSPFAQSFFPAVPITAYRCLDHKSANWPVDFVFQNCYEPPPHGELKKLMSGGFHLADLQRLIDKQSGCEAHATILPLSNDPAQIKGSIDALTPPPFGAYTHSALGVLWSHRLLLHTWKSEWVVRGPRPHPVGPDVDEVRRAIVLLTDGEDTQCGREDPGCDGNRRMGIPRTEACDAAKAAGTRIFVIAAMVPGQVSDALKAGLRACSSEADDPSGTYVFVENAEPEDLRNAFAEIAKQLRAIRRTH